MRLTGQSTAIILLGVLLPLGVHAQTDLEPAPTKDRPQMEIGLQKIGYETSGNAAARWRTFADFIDANHLAISWLTTRKRTAANPGEPTELHVLVLDVRSGEKTSLQSSPTPLSAARFAGIPNGKFLTCTGGLLRLFSADSIELRKLQLENDHACNGGLGTEGISPDRKSLLLTIHSAAHPEQPRSETLLNPETLAVAAEWSEGCQIVGLSDHWLAGRCAPMRERKFFIRSLDQTWQPFQPVSVSHPLGIVAFVRDDLVAVGAENQVLVTAINGKILFKVSAPDHNFVLRFATSLGGARFAAVEGKLRGLKSQPLDMYPFISQERVVVYSIPDQRAIYTVNVKGTSPWAPWASHLNHVALSPDGALLAVVSDDILRVYRLPEGDAGTKSAAQ